MTLADMIITVWHGKYLYGFWRPITAINLADTDGNNATDVDTTWVPLIAATPNYPEYTSGYAAITAAFTRALAGTFDTRHLQVTLISTAVPNTTRYYDSGAALREEVVNARVWLGIHFRFSDTLSRDMGIHLADWVLDHNFQPTHGR